MLIVAVKLGFLCTFQAFAKQFNMAPDDLDMHVIYDVSHNIAKVEEHIVDGKLKTLLVHRKVLLPVFLYIKPFVLKHFLCIRAQREHSLHTTL